MRPDPLAEPRHWFIPGLEALCPDDDGAPSLSLPSLADRTAEVVDSSSLRFLTASALEARRKEERKKEKEKQKAATAKELVVVPGVGEWVELVDEYGRTYFFNPQLGATRWSLPGSSSSSSTQKRKKKKEEEEAEAEEKDCEDEVTFLPFCVPAMYVATLAVLSRCCETCDGHSPGH